MARVASTKIDVQDLEYVIEYLLVFTFSRRAYSSDTSITKGKNRAKLLQAALKLEKALLELRDQEYLDAVERVCVDVDGGPALPGPFLHFVCGQLHTRRSRPDAGQPGPDDERVFLVLRVGPGAFRLVE